ncbi:MAG: hypothetical protein OER80_12150 [Gammaproteobacteria bacterium]|nr:hypothetical protein [Gammaproteobacteria bacterium]MDH3768157.1 hypothetical protein [Gammaproteobacteria bacterium]
MADDDKENEDAMPHHTGRWQLIRDATVFQFKLLADGLRDLVFAPVSLVMAIIDLITGGDRFYNLLSLGRRTDHWINLFGKYGGRGRGIDEAVNKVESILADQYQKGGITASAKKTVDRALDRLASEQGEDQD